MRAKQNQSTFDLATQTSGDVKSVLAFCLENDLPIAESLEAGKEYNLPSGGFSNENILNYFRSKEIELATGQDTAPENCDGIGCMIIETNFDVS